MMRFVRHPVLISAALAMASSVGTFAQARTSTSFSDGLELLKQVGKKYAGAKSYYIGGSEMTGEQIPSLRLKSADGKVISLDSFRGKPVLIDFWATWCSPCVTALPKLDKIYQEAKDKGLVLVLVDRDEEAKTATDFLAKKGYNWPDFHDDGEIEKLMGSSGIPREVLIDAQGKIVYDAGGLDGDELRTEIAKLGPEHASLRPKPKETACPAVN